MIQDPTNEFLTGDRIFLTDGGLETTLIFNHHIDLPEFAAFTLLDKKEGYKILRDYYLPYIRTARRTRAGFILESPTWRASSAWGNKLGYDAGDLKQINQTAVSMLEDLKFEFEDHGTPMIISGCIGPQGDGYHAANTLSVMEAKEYHLEQIATFRHTRADIVSAYTMNYIEEAIGVALAAKSVHMPVVISFTTETDGTLPSGQSLRQAIEQVDLVSGNYPVYYMLNCAHPTHFTDALENEDWIYRIRAIRANASCKSHEELETATELDSGDKKELALLYKGIKTRLPALQVFGGCCGTDHTHIHEISRQILY